MAHFRAHPGDHHTNETGDMGAMALEPPRAAAASICRRPVWAFGFIINYKINTG